MCLLRNAVGEKGHGWDGEGLWCVPELFAVLLRKGEPSASLCCGMDIPSHWPQCSTAELLPFAIHSQLAAPRAPHGMGIPVCSNEGGCPCSPPSLFQHSPLSPAGLGRGGGGCLCLTSASA